VLAIVVIQTAALAACQDEECHGIPFSCPSGCWAYYQEDFDCCCDRVVEGGCCQYTCIKKKCVYQMSSNPCGEGVSRAVNPSWPENVHENKECVDPPGTCQ
jgi:hypothetical protein